MQKNDIKKIVIEYEGSELKGFVFLNCNLVIKVDIVEDDTKVGYHVNLPEGIMCMTDWDYTVLETLVIRQLLGPRF